MRSWTTAALVAGILGSVGCGGWPGGKGPEALRVNQVTPACDTAPHFQITTADLTLWKSGYPGQAKGMMYASGKEKVSVLLNTCTGITYYLQQLDDKSTGVVTTRWIPITY